MRKILRLTQSQLLLTLILLGALVLRLTRLTFQSLRNDEHFSVYTSSFDTLREVILEGGILDKHPPGYAIFLHYWMLAFGDGEIAVRLPSVIAGVLAVWVIYTLGTRIASERLGLTAAALAAVSGMPIAFSQDARAYSLLMLFSVLLVLCVLHLIQAKAECRSTWKMRLWATLVAAITAYLHYFGLLAVALVGIVALVPVFRKRLGWADWATTFLGSALLYLPWLNTVMTHATARSSWMGLPSKHLVWNVCKQLFSGVPLFGFALLGLAGLQLGYDVLRTSRAKGDPKTQPLDMGLRWIPIFIAWILLPLASAVVVSYLVIPVISARNLIIAAPAICLLSAMAVAVLDVRWFKGRPVVAVVMTLGLVFQLVAVRNYYGKKTKRDYRAVARYLGTEATKHDSSPFIATEPGWDHWFDYYFVPREGHAGKFDVDHQVLRCAATAVTLKLALSETHPDSLWMVTNATPKLSHLPKKLEGYRRIGTRKFFGIHVLHWVKTGDLPTEAQGVPEDQEDDGAAAPEAEGVL